MRARMKTKRGTALCGVWAVTWRSLVHLPLGLAVFGLLLCLIIGVIFLFIVGGVYLFYGFWWQSIMAFTGSGVIFWAWRKFHLNRFFESPPSLL